MGAPFPHEMVHEGTDASGMEEWRCPVCGRHFVVRWPPDYERLVLDEGDPTATHVGTKGEIGLRGLRLARAPGGHAAPDDDAASGDAPGEADRRWLRDHGIDWDGAAG
jgi:hypothetical protein